MSNIVTMTRAEYEALLDRIEDAEDLAALALHRARVETIGTDAVRAECLPVESVKRVLAGESPVRVWRQHRGIRQVALALAAGVSTPYLNEIETGKKPGSLDAMARLARALKISLDDLAPSA